MTAQEQQMLQGLADRINQTTLAEKDSDAEQMIQQTLGRNPDALYVMAQTVLVQDYALDQAKKQIADLRAQVSQAQQHAAEPRHATSFLGNLLGRHDEPQQAAPPPPPVQQQYAGAGVGPGLAYPSGGYPIPNSPAPQGGGFLRSAMQTATGVAAGALAFEGIESLMHGFGHAAGYGTEFVGPGYEPAGFGGAPREEIVNNYYGDGSPEHHGETSFGQDRRDDVSDRHEDASQYGNASDTGDGARMHDASYVTSGGDQPGDDGTNADDLDGTSGSDYSAQGDDSMLSDDVGDQGSDADGGSDSGGDFGGGDDGGGDFGGDSSSF